MILTRVRDDPRLAATSFEFPALCLQVADLVDAASGVPPEGGCEPALPAATGQEILVGGDLVRHSESATDDGVLHRCDAQGQQVVMGTHKGARLVLSRLWRHVRSDGRHGLFLEHAGGLTVGIAYEEPVLGIDSVGIHSGDQQGSRVHPRAVAVA